MNYKNLKVIVPTTLAAACALFANGCSDSSEDAKSE